MTTEPTISCPSCRTEIRLTESLAAPLVEATRKRFEGMLADKDAEVAKREAAVRAQHEANEQMRASLDEQLAVRLESERVRITADESKKAKLIAATEIDRKSKELIDLQEVLNDRESKLAKAQQAEVMPIPSVQAPAG